MHFVVPGEILLFKAPSAVPPPRDALWIDAGGERHFTPAFYADLLSHLGATLVVRCGGIRYDPAPFLDRGIAVEPLSREMDADEDYSGCDGGCCCGGGGVGDDDDGSGGGLTLEALDRFLALADGVRGSIALHCGAGAAGHAVACALLSAYLLRRRHFIDPLDAVSWLSMARPGAGAPANALAAALRLAGARGVSRSASLGDAALLPPPSPAPPARSPAPAARGSADNREADGGVRLRSAPVARQWGMVRLASSPALRVLPGSPPSPARGKGGDSGSSPFADPASPAPAYPWAPARHLT